MEDMEFHGEERSCAGAREQKPGPGSRLRRLVMREWNSERERLNGRARCWRRQCDQRAPDQLGSDRPTRV